MLKPDKYLDFNVCVINISATIIHILLKNGISYYIEVLNQVKNIHGINSKYEFQNSLNFLYLLGKLNYYPQNDTLELIV